MTSDHPNQAMIPADSTQPVAATVNDPVETAVTLWAEASTRPETRGRDERLHDKREIVRAFLRFTGKHPGEVGPADVREWRQHLEEQGRAENTIYSYISRVSSFYEWLRKHPGLKEQIQTNPAELVRPKAPSPLCFAGAVQKLSSDKPGRNFGLRISNFALHATSSSTNRL